MNLLDTSWTNQFAFAFTAKNMVVVLEEPVTVRYNHYGSPVTVIVFLLCCLIVIVVPFIYGITTGNFYRKQEFFIERPRIFFPMKAVLKIKSNTVDSDRIWTTNTNVNNLLGDKLVTPVMKTDFTNSNDPTNYQQLSPDNLKFQFLFPQSASQPTRGVSAMLFFYLYLSTYKSLVFESVAHISIDAAAPAKSATVFATLKLHQDGVIQDLFSASQFNTTLLDLTQVNSLEQLNADDVLRKNKRAVYAQLQVDNVVWKEGYGDPFTLNIEITVPAQSLFYKPGFFEITKFAAVQYICAFYVIKWIVFTINRQLVLLGLLKTRKVKSSQKLI